MIHLPEHVIILFLTRDERKVPSCCHTLARAAATVPGELFKFCPYPWIQWARLAAANLEYAQT